MVAESSGTSGQSGSPGAGRWLSLAQAAAAQGVGPDALRKRIPAGHVRARKRGGRWQVWVPASDLDIRIVPDTPDIPETPRSEAPDDPEPPDAQERPEAEAWVRLLTLVETLQERNQVLAGQVGFLQAQRQMLEERVKLLQAPPEAEEVEEPHTQEAVAPETPETPERRPWWRRAWRLVVGD